MNVEYYLHEGLSFASCASWRCMPTLWFNSRGRSNSCKSNMMSCVCIKCCMIKMLPGSPFFLNIFAGSGCKRKYAMILGWHSIWIAKWSDPKQNLVLQRQGVFVIRSMKHLGGWWSMVRTRPKGSKPFQTGHPLCIWTLEQWHVSRWESKQNIKQHVLFSALVFLTAFSWLLDAFNDYACLLCFDSWGKNGKSWSGNSNLKRTQWLTCMNIYISSKFTHVMLDEVLSSAIWYPPDGHLVEGQGATPCSTQDFAVGVVTFKTILKRVPYNVWFGNAGWNMMLLQPWQTGNSLWPWNLVIHGMMHKWLKCGHIYIIMPACQSHVLGNRPCVSLMYNWCLR